MRAEICKVVKFVELLKMINDDEWRGHVTTSITGRSSGNVIIAIKKVKDVMSLRVGLTKKRDGVISYHDQVYFDCKVSSILDKNLEIIEWLSEQICKRRIKSARHNTTATIMESVAGL